MSLCKKYEEYLKYINVNTNIDYNYNNSNLYYNVSLLRLQCEDEKRNNKQLYYNIGLGIISATILGTSIDLYLRKL